MIFRVSRQPNAASRAEQQRNALIAVRQFAPKAARSVQGGGTSA